MGWFLLVCLGALFTFAVIFLSMLCVYLRGRVRKLEEDVDFWREEAIRLDNEKCGRL